MNRILLALLFLIPIHLRAAPLVVDWIETFEADANPLTTSALNAGLKTALSGSWAVNGSSAYFFTTTVGSFPIERGYTVRGVETNTVDSGTRAMAIRYYPAADETNNVAFTLGSGLAGMSFGFYFENNLSTSAFWDIVLFEGGGGYAVPQWRGTFYQSHTDAGGTGAPIYTGPGKHWITGSRTTSGLLTFAVYNATTRAQISTNSFLAVGANNVTIIKMSTDGHDTQQDVTNYFDNFMVTTNAGDFPLLPWDTNDFYVATTGSDSASGRTAAQAWLTLQKAADTVTAGARVYLADGTYSASVSETTDGTEANPITYIGGPGAVIGNRFDVTGDHVWLVGCTFTAASDLSVEPVRFTGTTGGGIMDATIYNTGNSTHSGGITVGNATNLTVRGNRLYTLGAMHVGGSDTDKKAIGERFGYNDSRNTIIEYNSISNVVEYINNAGEYQLIRNNVGGPAGTNFPAAHDDFNQPNGTQRYAWLEANWHEEHPHDDSHFYLDEAANTHHIVQYGNVSIRSGDILVNQWRNGTNHYANKNIWAETAVGPTRTLGSGHAFVVWDSVNNISRNEVFYLTTTDSLPYGLVGSGTLSISDYTMSNPGWTSYSGYFGTRNLLLTSGAAGRDAGTATLTTVASGGGSGVSGVTLTDSTWFHDGFGMTRGSIIAIGDDLGLVVTDVDHSTHAITFSPAITCSNGDAVSYNYRGSAPDWGAYEYGDALLTSATIATNGLTVTVTPNGDTRFVVFYVNGRPLPAIFDAPFSYTKTLESEVITAAKAYAMHAQPNPVITAGASQPAAPTTGTITTLNAVSANAGGSE